MLFDQSEFILKSKTSGTTDDFGHVRHFSWVFFPSRCVEIAFFLSVLSICDPYIT